MAAEIAVVGEALMDVVETGDDDPRLARPGGSPYNVAVGLARLGRRAAFVGRLSADPLGSLLRAHAERSDVDLSWSVAATEPSTVALVSLDGDGAAQYTFGVDGTADFCFTDAELAVVQDGTPALHFGSLTSWTAPGEAAVARLAGRLRAAGAAVSYDPNVRPFLQPDRDAARAQVEAGAGSAHLVKVSAEDLQWAYPGVPEETVAAGWLAGGACLVVVTHGGAGVHAVTRGGSVRVTRAPVPVVDTVGAGDAFMAGLLEALLRRGLLTPTGLAGLAEPVLVEVLQDAALVAELTCGRAGANPPRLAELAGLRGAR